MPSDIIPTPATEAFVAEHAEHRHDDDQHAAARPYQEINARRAELERPELLRTIRAL